jgi:hypothetical protein
MYTAVFRIQIHLPQARNCPPTSEFDESTLFFFEKKGGCHGNTELSSLTFLVPLKNGAKISCPAGARGRGGPRGVPTPRYFLYLYMNFARVGQQVTIVTVLWNVVLIVPQAVNKQPTNAGISNQSNITTFSAV